jgi:hypothetical protein
MKEENSWKSKAMLIKRTETSVSTTKQMDSINNGISSMPMNGKESQAKENSMRSSVYMLRDPSM